MKKLNLNENFISRIWAEKLYYSGLKTIDGKIVEVIDYGIRNMDSGADFKNAKIKIDGNLFCGDIEIHRSLKDWHLHKHKGDNKYNKVVLQVVFWEDDFPEDNLLPKVSKSREVPTVVLSKFLTKSIHEIWKEIIDNPSPDFKLPCSPDVENIDLDAKVNWVNILGLKRLNYRAERLKERLDVLEGQTGTTDKKSNWERLFFEFTLEALGFSKNKEQFLKFAYLLDYDKIKNDKVEGLELEALFFGSAGFLSGLRYKDDYIDAVKECWELIKEKYKPSVMNSAEWNFFRLRPQNFPTIRMAFAVSLFGEIVSNNFFKRLILCFEKSKNSKKDVKELFASIELPLYWQNHYVFGKPVKTGIKSIGDERIFDIITNVVLPLLYAYAVKFEKIDLNNKVLEYYTTTKEKHENEITRVMQKQTCFIAKTISDYQGLIHLHNFYCVKEKCNSCEIGKIIFKNGKGSGVLKIILY